MNDYDYKEEALKLRKKRNLILSPICIKIHNDIIYQLEKKISEFSENLEDYKKRINKILDEVEQDDIFDIKSAHDLYDSYYTFLSIAIMDYYYPPVYMRPIET